MVASVGPEALSRFTVTTSLFAKFWSVTVVVGSEPVAVAEDGESVRAAPASSTGALAGLSVPSQAWKRGVTVYVHVPDGTPASVQVSAATSPAHPPVTVAAPPSEP